MKYREVINSLGNEKFVNISKDWYNTETIINRCLDNDVDRYAILACVPFYIINQIYNEDYKNGCNMSTYDWLNETIDDSEVNRLLKKVKEIAEK